MGIIKKQEIKCVATFMIPPIGNVLAHIQNKNFFHRKGPVATWPLTVLQSVLLQSFGLLDTSKLVEECCQTCFLPRTMSTHKLYCRSQVIEHRLKLHFIHLPESWVTGNYWVTAVSVTSLLRTGYFGELHFSIESKWSLQYCGYFGNST